MYFINDASGFTVILKYGLEDEIIVEYKAFKDIVSEHMKELGFSINLVEIYFDIYPTMDVSSYYQLLHMDEIIDFLSKINDELLILFDNDVFVQTKASLLINNTILDKWFGKKMDDTPSNIMKKTMKKELGVL